MEQATLGGGCYWCLDAIFRRIKGITQVAAGYSGGNYNNPKTDDVYYKNTGHAEVVQVTFDPKVVDYRDILEIFFVMHNPTTLNRQDYDTGELYRSIIFYHSTVQKDIAEDMKQHFATTLWDDPVVTYIEQYERFWEAEESMQDFYAKRPNTGYCQMIINPKIQKLRKKFANRYIEA